MRHTLASDASLLCIRDCNGISKLPIIHPILPYIISFIRGSSDIPLLSLTMHTRGSGGCGHCMEEMCVMSEYSEERNKVWGQKHLTIYHPYVYDVVDRVSLNRRGISCPSCYFVIENTDLNVFLLYYWHTTDNSMMRWRNYRVSLFTKYDFIEQWFIFVLTWALTAAWAKWPAMLSSAR